MFQPLLGGNDQNLIITVSGKWDKESGPRIGNAVDIRAAN